MGKHYVPREYLRGFADGSERRFVWMYDKKKRRWSRPAIDKAAQQKDYYSAKEG